jgi:hypothetical protein
VLVSGKPNGKDGFEAFGARKVSGNPDFFEHCQEFGLLILRFRAWFVFYFLTSYDLEISEATNGVFAVEAAVDAKFIEDFCFFQFLRRLFCNVTKWL